MTEKEIEKSLCENANALGGLAIKLNSYHRNGVPDRMVLWPGARIDFIELKGKEGQRTKLQKYWEKILRSLGFEYFCIHSEQELNSYYSHVKNRKAGG